MPSSALALACPSPQRADGYARHQPEQGVLHQIIEEHWPEFRSRAEDAGGLPRFVVREFEDFLRCGILEHGLARLQCRRCGHEMVVAYSCKHRAWCPSCCGRRMADVAAHLVEEVLPPVPIRQWVCTIPWATRTAVAFDRRLCADVLGAFSSSLLRLLRWRAKRAFGLGSVDDARVGAITFVQRSDSALRVDPHFHTLAADGAWVADARGDLRFFPLGEPSQEDLAQLAAWTHAKLVRVLERHDRLDELAGDLPVLASCYGASAADRQLLGSAPGERTQKLFGPVALPKPGAPALVAECGGVNIHAGTAIDGRDRRRLERLCRYMGRPPICEERLERLEDGRVSYGFKSAWKDGTRGIVLDPLDFIARLCALVPPPRFHLVRYHGVFAGGSADRRLIVPERGRPQRSLEQLPLPEIALPPPLEPRPASSRHPWAWLLQRVFAVDVTVCPVPGCRGEMRLVERASTPDAIARALADLGLAPRPPTPPGRIPPRQLALPLNV